MTANIATINGKAAVAYQGATPWHRLGTPMFGFPDVEGALKAASLDWNVTLEPLFVKKSDGKFRSTKTSHRAVVRDCDSEILAVVTSQYVPIQNHEAFGVLNTACREFGITIETAGALGKGDRVWALAKLPDSIQPVPGDKVEGYFLITSGHNGWTPYTARLTPIRVVCQNTLTVAERQSDAIVKLVHVRTAVQELEVVAAMVTNLVQALKVTGETFTELARKKITNIDAYVDGVLGIKDITTLSQRAWLRRDDIRRYFTEGIGADLAPKSAWAAYNAVTQYIDHTRTATSPRVLKQADQSALFGQASRLKLKALQLAIAA
jgi:phage/plasmid-like protein (TIGR03299 family)